MDLPFSCMKEFHMLRIVLFAALLVAVLLAPALTLAQDSRTPTEICASAVPAADPETLSFDSAEQVLEPGVDYQAIFCTGVGPIYVDLLEKYTPVTVNNFVFLAKQGFYNNTTFHRVIQDFMVQGGDPEGTGRGGPGYRFEDEFVGFLHFDQPGWLAMANAGPGTNGSQFFITTVPTPHLNFRHTIFGEVLEGQDIVEAIEVRDPETATEPGTILNTIVIIEDPAEVITTYEAASPATQDEISTAFAAFAELLPPEVLAIDEATSGVFTTDETVALAPEAAQEGMAAYLTSHNHEYRAANIIVNTACDLENIAFTSIGYSLDVFASNEDAEAALNDPALAELAAAQGLEETTGGETDLTIYTRSDTFCDTEVVTALTYWQRGRFVSTAQITLPADVGVPLDQVLVGFVGLQIYEPVLSSILRPEIR